MDKNISFTLKVWRQKGPKDKGHFDTFQMKDIPGDTSFLEMMDILNGGLSMKVKNLSYSTTTVVKVSAVCALCISTDILTDLLQVLLPARFICVVSKTVTPLLLSLGVLPVSR